MTGLHVALEQSRELIVKALAKARSELAVLDERRNELTHQIAQAEGIVGGAGCENVHPRSTGGSATTLHDALSRVLEDTGNEWMSARELTDEVNRRGLYRTRDGSPVEVNQVHARTKNYADLFEKDGPKIRLKSGATLIGMEADDVIMFKDDDSGFFEWQYSNPEGEFINTERKPNRSYLVLHKSGCSHFKGSDSLRWTKDYVKVCSTKRAALETWASETIGGDMTLCGTCFRH
jgi:hypothetical protein